MKFSFVRPYHLFFAGILLLYLAFLTRTYYWDGVLFSIEIENVYQGRNPAITLFHPNHLLYTAFGYVLFCAVKLLLPGIRPLAVLQGLNVFISVAAAYVLFHVTRLSTNIRGVPFFCCLLFAFGATWWKFSTDADVYIICVLLILLSALFLLGPKRRLLLAALCHTLAMLFHELAVFTYVPVLVLLFFDSGRSLKKTWATALAYCAGTASFVAAAYLLCYSQVSHSAYPTLVSWITSYASDSGFTHSIGQLMGVYLSSYLKLFAGGKMSQVREFFSVLECAALLLSLALAIWALSLFKKPGSANEGKVESRALIFLWSWLVAYSLFLGAWDPGSNFHKLFVWPAVVLLIGAYLARGRFTRQHMRAVTALAGALAAWNFGAFIYPRSHAEADPVLVMAQKLNRELPKDAIVMYRVFDPDDWYLDYFAPGRDWRPFVVLDHLPVTRPVCLETTALAERHGAIDPAKKWDLVNSAHNIRLECLARGEQH